MAYGELLENVPCLVFGERMDYKFDGNNFKIRFSIDDALSVPLYMCLIGGGGYTVRCLDRFTL